MEIEYIKSNRKTLALEITKDLRVVVRMPRTFSMKRAERFVAEHTDWIERHYQRQQMRVEKYALDDEQLKELRRRAKEIIPKRVAYYAALTGLKPTAVRITSAKTRFGSCSGKNSLNFSIFLMLYSEGAIDYVVLHELCHIAHKNHSKQFYDLIGRYMPEYRTYMAELKN